MKTFTRFALIMLVIAMSGSDAVGRKAAIVLVSKIGKIPTGYSTYSLFLICNPQWLNNQVDKSIEGIPSSVPIEGLYLKFRAFGEAIGDKNLAVWFWDDHNTKAAFHPDAVYVDVPRSARFCEQWKLKPSDGPYLVITSTYPDEKHLLPLENPSAVFELRGMREDQIQTLLSTVTDDLVLGKKIDARSNIASDQRDDSVASAVLWVQLLSAVQKTINNFGCMWKFEVESGPVKASLHSCQEPETGGKVD